MNLFVLLLVLLLIGHMYGAVGVLLAILALPLLAISVTILIVALWAYVDRRLGK